jgi:uncharacterized protein YndB with AHSA1/START domain
VATTNAATKDEPLVVERTFDAPASLVWKALTDKEDIKQWSFDIPEFAPKVGFEFQFYGESEGVKYLHRCKITEAIPNKRLAYTWRYDGYAGDSLVSFDLFAEADKTRVRLTHEGLETFPRLPAFAKANFVQGWTQILGSSLKDFVEANRGTTPVGGREMVVTRVFDAPRRLVFETWSDPKHLARWWGPKGFTLPGCELEFRPGGAYRFVMRGPDGGDYPFHGVYREIVAPERIVFTAVIDNAPGNELVTTVIFAEEGSRTRLTVKQTVPAEPYARGQEQGWTESLECLADYLGSLATLVGDREIAAVRVFDASRDLVWKVWTEPEHIAKWWGPKGFTTTTYSMDVRPGGVWRFVMHGPDRDYQNKITYLEVVKPERLVYKHGGEKEVEPVNFQVTVIFAEQRAKTRVDMRMVFPSARARDYVIETYGAVEGLTQTLGRLEEYLAVSS